MRGLSSSPEDTYDLALTVARKLPSNAVLCFFGELASGKTTFIKGLAKAYNIPQEEVMSPTYVYLNIHNGKVPFYHFDLYRLKNEEEFLGLGFDEFLFADGIKCLEWSERIPALIPPDAIKVYCSHVDEKTREYKIEGL